MTSIFEHTEKAKDQINEDIDAGRVPKDVPDFSALHDFVDANEYIGSDLNISSKDDLAMANEIIDRLDKWITEGRPDTKGLEFRKRGLKAEWVSMGGGCSAIHVVMPEQLHRYCVVTDGEGTAATPGATKADIGLYVGLDGEHTGWVTVLVENPERLLGAVAAVALDMLDYWV